MLLDNPTIMERGPKHAGIYDDDLVFDEVLTIDESVGILRTLAEETNRREIQEFLDEHPTPLQAWVDYKKSLDPFRDRILAKFYYDIYDMSEPSSSWALWKVGTARVRAFVEDPSEFSPEKWQELLDARITFECQKLEFNTFCLKYLEGYGYETIDELERIATDGEDEKAGELARKRCHAIKSYVRSYEENIESRMRIPGDLIPIVETFILSLGKN